MTDLVDLYIFRHGETDWNAKRKFQGHTDIPLNDQGRSQATSLIDKFKNLSPEVCLSSDLVRAVETAKIGLKDHNLSYLYSDQLRETYLGDVEGLSQQDIIDRYGLELLTRWRSVSASDLEMSFPNGESKLDHLLRIQNFLKNFVSLNQEIKKIAVSTHGGSVVRLVHSCFNAPEDSIKIPNCCLYHVQYSINKDHFYFVAEL
ncbi:MAG: histidine phosphatase family protein [Bdellovibrionales bacterium]|nr:histidine phosphatase family protein [Bdellovibrionales bacterium]